MRAPVRQSITGSFLKLSRPQCFRYSSTSKPFYADSEGLFQSALLPSKSYIKIRGPDAPKFLNGLVTSKLLPHYVKKNLTTINPNDSEKLEDVLEFDKTQGNWGLYVEWSENGAYLSRFGLYTGILNSKGKLITDTIVYPTPLIGSDNAKLNKYPTYLLEFDNSIIESVYDSFNVHKLASRVKLKRMGSGILRSWDVQIQLPGIPKDVTNPWVVNLLNPATTAKSPEEALEYARSITSLLFHGNEEQIEALYIERRIEDQLLRNGSLPQVFRVITKGDVDDVSSLFNPVGLPFEFKTERKQPQFFRKARFEAGYVDSTTDFQPQTLLPLELNFDYIANAVSSDKGCYVGQELTARTFATGILRKRLVPVTLTNVSAATDRLLSMGKYPEIKIRNPPKMMEESAFRDSATPFANTVPSAIPPRPRRQRPAGSLIAHEGDKGVALLRVEHFASAFGQENSEDLFYIETQPDDSAEPKEGSSNISVIPQRPNWLDESESDSQNL